MKFGAGASAEIGYDLAASGARRVLLVTDPGVAATGHPARIAEQVRGRGLDVTTYAGRGWSRPTPRWTTAIGFARDAGPFDAMVAVGGGSAIDTAKAVNLLLTNAGELMDYVNAPVGGGQAPASRCCRWWPSRRRPAPAPRATTICVLDVLDLQVKTGISHAAAAAHARRGRPRR